MRKPLCKGSGLEFIRRPGRRGIEYLPAKQLANPWVLLQGELDRECDAGTAGAFIADMPGAALVVLPQTGSHLPTARDLVAEIPGSLRHPGETLLGRR